MARTPEQNRRYYEARTLRAQSKGLTGYAQWRSLSKQARSEGLDPTAGVPPDGEPPGLQGPFGPSPDPDWDYYWPTKTKTGVTVPGRRPKYSQMARYSARYQRMEIIFRDGTPWHWGPDTGVGVPQMAWDIFKRGASTWEQIRGPNEWMQDQFSVGAHGGWGSLEYGG